MLNDSHHDDQFDESETALADRPSLAPLHVVHRETSFRVHTNMQEKWWAPRRKLSAGARTVPTLRGHGPGFPHAVGRRSPSPRTENQRRAFAAGHGGGHRPSVGGCPPSIEVTWTCQAIDSRSPVDEHSRETS